MTADELRRSAADAGLGEVEVDEWEGLLLAHDPVAARRADVVTGINPAGMTMARMTVRREVESALDLGTGCGVQALLSARHARHVVATDVNERALAFARLNARANGAELDLRAGSLFEPVGGERFDLLVSNPPYVISPDADLVFRDSGRPGDALVRDVVSGAPEVLTDGGFATVLANWVLRAEEEWWGPLEEWVAGRGCDAWLLHFRDEPPAEYAEIWNKTLAEEDRQRAVARWTAYYDEEGIDRIGVGAVVVRRGGRGWIDRAEMTLGPGGWGSDQILRVFAAHDALADDADVLARRLVPIDPHRLEQVLEYRDGGYLVAGARMGVEDGVGVVGDVPANVLHVLLRLDGSALREVVARAEAETGLALRDDAEAAARRLYELGFLVDGKD